MTNIFYRIAIILTIAIAISSVFLVTDVKLKEARFQSGGSDSVVGGLENGIVIEQHVFNMFNAVEAFQLRFGTYVRTNHSTVTIELLNSEKNVEQVWAYDASGIWDGSYLECKLNQPYRGEDFYIRVSSDADANNSVTLFCSSSDSYLDGELTKNGEAQAGDLDFIINGQQQMTSYLILFLINAVWATLAWIFMPKVINYFEKRKNDLATKNV